MDDNFCYVIDEYNKFQINKNVVKTFNLFIGGRYVPYCIRKIPVVYDWGLPQLTPWEEQDFEKDYSQQFVYHTEEEALCFVRELRRMNG